MPCFHDARYYDDNVSSCKLIVNTDNKKYHVIHFKDHIYYDNLQHFESVKYHYTKHNHIDEIWEEVSEIPHNTLYSIDKRTDISFIFELAQQLIQWFCLITQQDLYYEHLNTPSKCVNFLQSNATFVYVNEKPKYIQVNRFQLKNANLMALVQKRKKLFHQIYNIPLLIKTLFFQKNRHNTTKNIESCYDHCKITNFTFRYMIHNTTLIQNFHEVLCKIGPTEKIESFERLTELFPTESINIHETITYLNNLI